MKHRVRPSAVQRWRHFKDDPVVRGAPANRGAIKVPGGVKDEREGLRSSFELPAFGAVLLKEGAWGGEDFSADVPRADVAPRQALSSDRSLRLERH